MTRALGIRSSKRKPSNASQEVIPDDCKENSPSILSQNTRRRALSNKKSSTSKENEPPKTSNLKTNSPTLGKTVNFNFRSPMRKSVRRLKPVECAWNKPDRNVLSDRTNSPSNADAANIIDNKTNTSNKIISITKLSSDDETKENHVPIYKTLGSELGLESEKIPLEKKEAVYEFEFDENEEPVQKRKRKKRIYVRKPKSGPKALTINNIKYSSSESLASLPEKPLVRKKKTSKAVKSNLKPYSSVTSLNNPEDSDLSVMSFRSHPPSLIMCRNGKKHPTCSKELSVLQETQSENLQSPNLPLKPRINGYIQTPKSVLSMSKANKEFHNYSHSMEPNLAPNAIQLHNSPACSPTNKKNSLSTSYRSNFSPNPRCYVSKSGRTPTPHRSADYISNSPAHESLILYSPNTSSGSRDFLSSTPFKRQSLVVKNNSVFDYSHDCPSPSLSTGCMLNPPKNDDAVENCFGFDEPEELEVPLVSPIKNCNDLKPRQMRKPPVITLDKNDQHQPPLVQDVINLLKSTLPVKSVPLEGSTEVYQTSPQGSEPPSPRHAGEEISSFSKPPRRSYERQRRVRYISESAKEESEEENKPEEKEPEEKNKVVKEVKKIYRRANVTKSERAPKVTKAKQRMNKEEEELERLVAQMNAQFQEIEKVNLVVE